jgi:type IV secretory pathway VirB9-like protein
VYYSEDNVARDADNVTNMFKEHASINDMFMANIDGKNKTEWTVKFEVGNSVLE